MAQLLPDLTPLADEARNFIYGWTVIGDQLRLTTAMANIGEGAMELRGGDVNGDVQEVYQRIYNDDGTYSEVLAGEFQHHDEHGHIHFEDFAEFRLREVLPDGSAGEVVATGDKVSFCLIDVTQTDSGTTTNAQYLSCGQVQGISPGWSDVYSSGLPGQSIEIGNVPDGDYILEVIVDPLNQLIEADETNNVEQILISLERPGSETPVAIDAFEDNDNFATASILAPPEDHRYENLTIDSAGDSDYYRVTASGDGQLTFGIEFAHGVGDLDMRVYDAAQTQLGISQSVTDNEEFSVEAVAGDQFYVRVYGYDGALSTDYTLVVDQPDHAHPEPENVFHDVENVTQFIQGDPVEHDAFMIHDIAANYGWGPTEDGTGTVVWGPTGHDILFNIDAIQFSDVTVPLTGSTDGVHQDIVGVDQHLSGTTSNDVFVVNASSTGYNWGPTEDGAGIVIWNDQNFDILQGFESIQFTDRTVDVTTSDGPLVVADDPTHTQHLTGTQGVDRFVINGNQADYSYGATQDGAGVVVWNDTGYDVLQDFEELEFNDNVVTLEAFA